MDHKFHNHSLRKNSLIEEELKVSLSKLEKQKHDKLAQIRTRREEFRKLHSRQHMKHSLDLDRECSSRNSITTIAALEMMKDSKRFASEPNLFAKRNVLLERKATFPFVEPAKCLPYRKLHSHETISPTGSFTSLSLDSGIEIGGADSTVNSEHENAAKSSGNHRTSYSTPILAFPLIASAGHHDDLKRKSSRAKMCFYKAMGNRITSENGWKYLMTNVFKRLNESPYKHENKEDIHHHNDNMDDIALCRYLRVPVKYQSENEDHPWENDFGE